MKVRCIKTTIELDKELLIDTNGKLGMANHSNAIEIGRIYNVYAILDSKYNRKYLIYVNQLIHFIHSVCFELIESKIPNEWKEKEFRINERSYHLTGYELLVNDTNHYDNLLMNDSEALMRFFEENKLF